MMLPCKLTNSMLYPVVIKPLLQFFLSCVLSLTIYFNDPLPRKGKTFNSNSDAVRQLWWKTQTFCIGRFNFTLLELFCLYEDLDSDCWLKFLFMVVTLNKAIRLLAFTDLLLFRPTLISKNEYCKNYHSLRTYYITVKIISRYIGASVIFDAFISWLIRLIQWWK